MTHKVFYQGNSTRLRNFEADVTANSLREAVEAAYAKYMDNDYFPQEDGSILDCNGNEIAGASDETIAYDGGGFYAVPVSDIKTVYITMAKHYPANHLIAATVYDARGNQHDETHHVSTDGIEYDEKKQYAIDQVKEEYEGEGYNVIIQL